MSSSIGQGTRNVCFRTFDEYTTASSNKRSKSLDVHLFFVVSWCIQDCAFQASVFLVSDSIFEVNHHLEKLSSSVRTLSFLRKACMSAVSLYSYFVEVDHWGSWQDPIQNHAGSWKGPSPGSSPRYVRQPSTGFDDRCRWFVSACDSQKYDEFPEDESKFLMYPDFASPS